MALQESSLNNEDLALTSIFDSSALLESAKDLAQTKLQGFAQSQDFENKIALAFGQGRSVDKFRSIWLTGKISFPAIEIRTRAELGNAYGAFSQETGKIYLAQELINTNSKALISSVLLEEYGHFVDAQLNVVDSMGDEGAIFAALVQGKGLDVETLQALRTEDDYAVINLNGQSIQVEQHIIEDPGEIVFYGYYDPVTGTMTYGHVVGPVDGGVLYEFIYAVPFVDNGVLRGRVVKIIQSVLRPSPPPSNSVSLSISTANVAEDGTQNLVYTFTRTGDLNISLTVDFDIAGTATYGRDYSQTGATSFYLNAGTIFFEANSATATLVIDPIADASVESNETVSLTLASGAYNANTTNAITGTITNDDSRNIEQITNNNTYDSIEKLSGNNIVWYGRDGNGYVNSLYFYNGTTTTQFVTNGVSLPQTSGNNIVWQSYDDGDSEIYFYNGTKTTKLTSNNTFDHDPKISRNNIVWLGQSQLDPSKYADQVFFYNGTTITAY